MGICLKVNVIARLEFELAYHDSAVQRFHHYTAETPLRIYMCAYVCVCDGIYVCVYMCMCDCTCMCVYVCVWRYICMYVCVCVCVWQHLFICVWVSTCVWRYICMCVYMCVYVPAYTQCELSQFHTLICAVSQDWCSKVIPSYFWTKGF